MLGFGDCTVQHIEGDTFRALTPDGDKSVEFKGSLDQNPVTASSAALEQLHQEALDALAKAD